MKEMLKRTSRTAAAALGCLALASGPASVSTAQEAIDQPVYRPWQRPKARNVIFFVGDGMGVSTVTATRIYSVGVDGELVVDLFPNTALSRTYTSDHITPDSAGTMTAMMTGKNANSGVIGYGAETERQDFNNDGNGPKLWTLAELAKKHGMKVGVISTPRVTHATPAACYAHVLDRNFEDDIAAQALPGDANYNERLGAGLDLLMGGGRRHFVPAGTTDEEGSGGSRGDGRDLRAEFQAAGYSYVWNQTGFDALDSDDLPVLGLFEASHMEYEYDRPNDLGGEPSITEMTVKAIDLLEEASEGGRRGYFLMVESGRIDHAHHASNAYRSLTDTEEFDRAIGEAILRVDLSETLIVVTADHSHVFNIAGYPLVTADELPYEPTSAPESYLESPDNGIFDIVYDINTSGEIFEAGDSNGVPYTKLVYGNGPGYRGGERVDPREDKHAGLDGEAPEGPNDPEYLQEAAVPLGSETHSAEEVAMYAIGPNSHKVNGTVKNTRTFDVMREALNLNPNPWW